MPERSEADPRRTARVVAGATSSHPPTAAAGELDPDLAIFQVMLAIWVFMGNLVFVTFRRLNFKTFSKTISGLLVFNLCLRLVFWKNCHFAQRTADTSVPSSKALAHS